MVRVTDVPAVGRGCAFLVERELEQDGQAALNAQSPTTSSTPAASPAR